ncbi:TapY2 family type IVa secretion system protein [Paraferrimonas sedimenticola]|uniref:Uncharacterized protein n=1 Tax=Paraferrimonas sedimenticola TaxID=375674 RepID=A0AA37RY77_9GAMM|nr:TapY2 family type IVa secretion system protein [Paraferrimonas sedimenticola]GLP97139.1 hypothetical protein GCM10007895_24460 [Paraferrimonas sedimenticola]
MKIWIAVVLALLVSFSASAAKQQKAKQDYKCAVTTPYGDKLQFYRWPVAQKQARQAKLVGTKVKLTPGLRKKATYTVAEDKSYIMSVYECTELKSEFTHPIARELDAGTPR